MEKREFEREFEACGGKLSAVYLSEGITIWATEYATFEENIELFYNGAFIARIPLKSIKKVY